MREAIAQSSTPGELAAYVKSELALYAKIVKHAGMRPDLPPGQK
jgi:hypothetical protein